MDIYNDFLSPEEIYLLTERKQYARQIEQLNAQGIPFVLTGRNRPIVRRDYNAATKRRTTQTIQPIEWASNAPKLEGKQNAKTTKTRKSGTTTRATLP